MNKRFRYTALLCLGVMLCGVVTPMDSQVSAASTRQMEKLNRGAVAVKVPEGVLVSWRLLGTEADSVGFNLYRGTSKVNDAPIPSRTNFWTRQVRPHLRILFVPWSMEQSRPLLLR